MIRYTVEYRQMRARWLRALVLPAACMLAGVALLAAWDATGRPQLARGLAFLQPLVDSLPVLLWFCGIVAALLQTYRLRRCPACGRRLERRSKLACRHCKTSFEQAP